MENALERCIPSWAMNIKPKIAVIGVGGAGCAAVNHIYWTEDDLDTIAINTDQTSLGKIGAHQKICLYSHVLQKETERSPELGRLSALAHTSEITNIIRGHDIVFVIAGMGGGTGTGAAPVVAEISSRLGMITFGIAIMPFSVEDKEAIAREGLRRLRSAAPMTVAIDNDILIEKAPRASVPYVFEMVNAGIHDYINQKAKKVTEVFLEQLIDLEMEVGNLYYEWPATDLDMIRILFP